MRFHRIAVSAALLVTVFYAGLILSLLHFLHPSSLTQALAAPRTLFSVGLSLGAATLATGLALPLAILDNPTTGQANGGAQKSANGSLLNATIIGEPAGGQTSKSTSGTFENHTGMNPSPTGL